MNKCIFCKIIKGEVPATKIWENNDFLAILDIQPVVRGMTVVLPKKHYSPKIFEMDKEIYSDFMEAGRTVARKLKKGLDAERVFMVAEGLDVNHAHLKLYPVKDAQPLGLLLTRPSSQKDREELEEVKKEIQS